MVDLPFREYVGYFIKAITYTNIYQSTLWSLLRQGISRKDVSSDLKYCIIDIIDKESKKIGEPAFKWSCDEPRGIFSDLKSLNELTGEPKRCLTLFELACMAIVDCASGIQKSDSGKRLNKPLKWFIEEINSVLFGLLTGKMNNIHLIILSSALEYMSGDKCYLDCTYLPRFPACLTDSREILYFSKEMELFRESDIRTFVYHTVSNMVGVFKYKKYYSSPIEDYYYFKNLGYVVSLILYYYLREHDLSSDYKQLMDLTSDLKDGFSSKESLLALSSKQFVENFSLLTALLYDNAYVYASAMYYCLSSDYDNYSGKNLHIISKIVDHNFTEASNKLKLLSEPNELTVSYTLRDYLLKG